MRQLLDGSPLHTDDGELLRRTALDVGALHLLLACLSVFTHQAQDTHLPGVQHELVAAATKASKASASAAAAAAAAASKEQGRAKPASAAVAVPDDKSQLYWAKGTGFGTGSTAQCWNVEQALVRQRSEEEQVTVLLQAVAAFLNPRDSLPLRIHGPLSDSDSDDPTDDRDRVPPARLPPLVPQLLQKSCLLPALCSYLRNDSGVLE